MIEKMNNSYVDVEEEIMDKVKYGLDQIYMEDDADKCVHLVLVDVQNVWENQRKQQYRQNSFFFHWQ